jgi:hypothetical protein
MTNKRIYYAIQQVGIKADGNANAFGATDVIHGVQSVGMTTNFNLEQVFELGQLEIYENMENLPDVEVTLQKALDGYPLIYHQATKGTTTISPTLPGRSTSKCIFGMSIFDETLEAATGTPGSVVQCSGMFLNSSSFTFGRDGFFTEDATLVGNDKVWKNTPTHGRTLNANLPTPDFPGQFNPNSPDSPIGDGGINRRENILFDYAAASGTDVNGAAKDPDATILPPDVLGITSSGTNEKTGGVYGAHISSISVSTDLNRETIDELGRKGPYHRVVGFPVEVTCEIEVTSTSGDLVSATEDGIYTTGTACGDDLGNLLNRTIRIATCEGTRIYLGQKNKLQSVSYGGGDAGGGDVTVTYGFSTFNSYTVMHPQDPHASGSAWWTARGSYLVDA